MLCAETLAAAIDGSEGPAEISKVEFEVLENGTIRWLLWDGTRRLFAATLNRQELVEALQASGVLLRTMTLVKTEGVLHGR